MSSDRTAATAVQHAGAGAGRLARAWRALPPERRLAAFAAIGLFLTLFLPWYQETVLVNGRVTSGSFTGWGAFSFVEAGVLIVGVGVLTLLFQRAEGRAFHLPGGDGSVIMGAGAWAGVLVTWRIFDKESVNTRGALATVAGVDWGIFAALAIAALLVYAGSRIRAAHRPEPPLPGERRPARAARDRSADADGETWSAPAARDRSADADGETWSALAARDRSADEGGETRSAPAAAPRAAVPGGVRSAPQRPVGWLSAPPPEDLSTKPLRTDPAAKRPVRFPKPVRAEDPGRRS
ncbi:MAG: hypothetical protein DLM64_11000 [Solirubrobacterales bacterium]|nr:MAG: hypothetical protein DLM64_11000 [Solirubrobacterales bacterium]